MATHTSHDKTSSSEPKSVPARLSAGMMPYFIPAVNNTNSNNNIDDNNNSWRPCDTTTTSEGILDPTLMTPPMSPTDHSFASIESRFTSSFSLDVQSPQTDMTGSSVFGSISSPTSSASLSTDAISPRPISFHWEDYKESEDEDEQDEDDHHCEHTGYSSESNSRQRRPKETSSSPSLEPRPYYQQFEGHHSVARRSQRSSSVSSPSSIPSYSSYFATGEIPEETTYDSFRDGIGLNVADMSEEIAKARTKMSRASRAMKNMDHELEALQLSIDENKNTSATARTALEENFWKLECLAHNLEKDRQDLNKQLQSVGKDCGQAVETVTNWEVRIDWLGKRVDNTSEYVSELVLSEQECMSFVKLIIKQNKQYAMPAISRSTERNIKLLAPPKLKEIAHTPAPPSVPQPIRTPPLPAPYDTPTPRMANVPISWLLDPILPQRPPEILSASAEPIHEDARTSGSPSGKRSTEPADVWRDFSRLTLAFESGQPRTPFSPFHLSGARSKSGSASSTGSLTGIAGVGPSFKTTSTIRRPQLENMTPMPRVLPVSSSAPTGKFPGIKRRGQYLPVHSWLQLQFNKTMTTPGPLGKSTTKKDTGFKSITIFQTTV
ncbi:hypothetical protein BG006_003057 [Podila minutissima]|uniref:Uncharacterized protein n=1 Tax=Podila minutissima TaxID=64525 RepID=A0A9P5SNM1_9FUNG|nr:hypothetical protein BG006_003057 [Podila minutissima]